MIVNALRTSEMCKWLGWRGLLTGNIVQSDTLRNVAFYGAVFKMLEQSVSAIKLLKGDFILYGEVEIYRVTPDLSIKWSFSGKDIFVRYHNNEPEPAFKMKKDRICLYDFGDNYYEINYDGILLDSKFVLKE